MTYLDLSDNVLTGTLPSNVGSLTNLNTLLLFQNQLTGPFPASITGLQSLQYVHGHEQARLPRWRLTCAGDVRGAPRLFMMYINPLATTVPSTFGALTSMWCCYHTRGCIGFS